MVSRESHRVQVLNDVVNGSHPSDIVPKYLWEPFDHGDCAHFKVVVDNILCIVGPVILDERVANAV